MTPNLDLLKEQFHLHGAALSKIEHQDAMVAEVFLVQKADGTECILKSSSRPNDCHREQYFLKRLQGIIPLPEILAENGTNAFLMTKLSGTLLALEQISEKAAHEIGVILANLHSQRTSTYGDLIDPASLSKDPQTPFTAKFEEGLAECSNHLPPDLLHQCRLQFDHLLPLLNDTDGPCLIHRDYRPGNILIDHEAVQGVIDWASARAGFAEEDFSAFDETPWPHQPFLQGYASIRPVPAYKPLLPLLRLSKAIASIGFTVKRGTWNNKDAVFYQRHMQSLQLLLA